MSGRLVINGSTVLRGSQGENSGTHRSEATAIWLQGMAPLQAGDTVALQGHFHAHDGYVAGRSHQLLGSETRMTNRQSLIEQILQAFRDHGIAAAIGVWFTFIAGLATAVTRKAFTNEALLHKLEKELAEERTRIEKRRDEDRRIDHDRLARIERDIHDMRNLIFAAFQRRDGD